MIDYTTDLGQTYMPMAAKVEVFDDYRIGSRSWARLPNGLVQRTGGLDAKGVAARSVADRIAPIELLADVVRRALLGGGDGASAGFRSDADVATGDAGRKVDALDGAAAAYSAMTARPIVAAVFTGSAVGDGVAGVVLEAERRGAGIDRLTAVPFVAAARDELMRAVDELLIAATVCIAGVDAQAEFGELDDTNTVHAIVWIPVRKRAIVVWSAIGVLGAIPGSADACALAGAEGVLSALRNRIAGVVIQTIGRSAGIDCLAFGIRFATIGNWGCAALAAQAAVARAGIVALAVLHRIDADPVDAGRGMRYQTIA